MQSVPITTNVVSSNPAHGEVYSLQYCVIKFVSDFRQFSPGISVSSTNKTDHHDITEILLKVALNTITHHTHPISLKLYVSPTTEYNFSALRFVFKKNKSKVWPETCLLSLILHLLLFLFLIFGMYKFIAHQIKKPFGYLHFISSHRSVIRDIHGSKHSTFKISKFRIFISRNNHFLELEISIVLSMYVERISPIAIFHIVNKLIKL